jgi:hypothetical protein
MELEGISGEYRGRAVPSMDAEIVKRTANAVLLAILWVADACARRGSDFGSDKE